MVSSQHMRSIGRWIALRIRHPDGELRMRSRITESERYTLAFTHCWHVCSTRRVEQHSVGSHRDADAQWSGGTSCLWSLWGGSAVLIKCVSSLTSLTDISSWRLLTFPAVWLLNISQFANEGLALNSWMALIMTPAISMMTLWWLFSLLRPHQTLSIIAMHNLSWILQHIPDWIIEQWQWTWISLHISRFIGRRIRSALNVVLNI